VFSEAGFSSQIPVLMRIHRRMDDYCFRFTSKYLGSALKYTTWRCRPSAPLQWQWLVPTYVPPPPPPRPGRAAVPAGVAHGPYPAPSLLSRRQLGGGSPGGWVW
jgi:hypothetical protein